MRNDEVITRLNEAKILVVIPTYNNAGTVAEVIRQASRYADHLLVINDGSTDQTDELIAATPHISYSPNRGKGYAIQCALRYAADEGYDYILTIDADGQHYAEDIARFAEAEAQHPGALIIGARNLAADNMPSKNTFANRFSNFWYRVETAQRLEDTQSGMRLYPIASLIGKHFVTRRYEFEVEVIVRAAWSGIEVINIPIRVHYPPKEERVSHFKPLKDFTRISLLNTVLVLIALLYYYPLCALRWCTPSNFKRFAHDNITATKESNLRLAAALGLGVCFGIIPIWGYQMIAAAAVAHLLGLNKVLTLLSSNISIPPMIPFILLGSYYTGSLLLGKPMEIDTSMLTLENVWQDLWQYLIGATVFGVACGVIVFAASYLLLLLLRKQPTN